jgi:hypothetical protein
MYSASPRNLILDVIDPILRSAQSSLGRCFWERHCLGGAHVRVRLVGDSGKVEEVAAGLSRSARHYFAAHPSTVDKEYSEERVRAFCASESDRSPKRAELRYRVDTVEEGGYWRRRADLASPQALDLLETFLQERMHLAAAILRLETAHARKLELLRLYWFLATMGFRSIAHGCVSYRSHWEGFAVRASRRPLAERVEQAYMRNRAMFAEECRSVSAAQSDLSNYAQLQEAATVFGRVTERTRLYLASGTCLTKQAESADQVLRLRQRLPADVDANRFLSSLYRDERFLASWSGEPKLIVPRVRTNLLYSLVRDMGLSMLDRFSLCYFAFRTAEAVFEVDLCDLLCENIDAVVATAQA